MRGYWSTTQVCEFLECSLDELRRAIEDGRIKPIQVAHGKKRWFLETEIKALVGDAA